MDVVYLIVTYEPNQEEFLENLSLNINSASHIIIVDNSFRNESIKFVKSLKKSNISIIQNLENKGIAEAQNLGINKFFELKYEYLLQLDQDSSISEKSLYLLLEYYRKNISKFNLAGVGPGNPNTKSKEVREIKSAGLLLKKDVIKKVGLFQSDLFIDLVDYEWCWRAKNKYNYKFHEVPCELNHQLGDNFDLFGLFEISIPSPIRHYYQVRNSLKLIFTFKAPLFWSLLRIPIILFKFILYPILLPSGKLRFKYMIAGFEDFYLGKSGKIKEDITR